MNRLVVIDLGSGTLQDGCDHVTAKISLGIGHSPVMQCRGSLPPAPDFVQLYKKWQLLYQEFYRQQFWQLDPTQKSDEKSTRQITIESQGITNFSEVEFRDLCRTVTIQLNAWLNSEVFQSIYLKICQELNMADDIQLILETDDPLLRQLPWQLWDFFETYPKAEFVLGTQEYGTVTPISQTAPGKVRILAIFGNSTNLDLDADRQAIQSLPEAEVVFLNSPSRHQLNEHLWAKQGWDILFFAGHSQTDTVTGTGEIQINASESLTVAQLKQALKKSRNQGLHLAIFNSCDGLGLAKALADLDIPQIIVMREMVPDQVAQEFFRHFLTVFTAGLSIFAAVREAREKLEGLENKYPCATWLPIICQNPATLPKNWQQLQGEGLQTSDSSCTNPRRLSAGFMVTLGATILVMGVRTLGLLQGWELKAYDLLIQQQPIESKDHRFLIVSITEEDLRSRPLQKVGADSLPDSQLVKLLDKLGSYQPRTIGLDIFRPDEGRTVPSNLAKHLKRDHFFGICQRENTTDFSHSDISPSALLPEERQGFSDVILDPGNVLRRSLLVMGPNAASDCRTQYALSTQLALYYLEQKGIAVGYTQNDELQLGKTIIRRLPSPREDNPFIDLVHSRQGGYQRVDTWGYQTLINFRSHRTPDDSFATVDLQDVLQGKLNPEMVKDRIVLIGVSAPSFGDIHPTPYSSSQLQQTYIPGVVIQAQMTSQLISAALDGRPLISVWPLWGEFMWVWGWSIAGGILLWLFRGSRLKSIAVGLVLGGGLYGLGWMLMVQGLWVPLIPIVLALGVIGSCVVVFNARFSEQRPE